MPQINDARFTEEELESFLKENGGGGAITS